MPRGRHYDTAGARAGLPTRGRWVRLAEAERAEMEVIGLHGLIQAGLPGLGIGAEVIAGQVAAQPCDKHPAEPSGHSPPFRIAVGQKPAHSHFNQRPVRPPNGKTG
jgi:hypothetical protein